MILNQTIKFNILEIDELIQYKLEANEQCIPEQ